VDLLKRDGTLIIVGAIGSLKGSLDTSHMAFDRKSITASICGSIAETQEVLDFCAKHNIKPDIAVIAIDDINDAFHDVHDGDAGFRYVIDMNTLRKKAHHTPDQVPAKVRRIG
jgi:uncharacterized zinc-type alcohol dehydrogenase-like protein